MNLPHPHTGGACGIPHITQWPVCPQVQSLDTARHPQTSLLENITSPRSTGTLQCSALSCGSDTSRELQERNPRALYKWQREIQSLLVNCHCCSAIRQLGHSPQQHLQQFWMGSRTWDSIQSTAGENKPGMVGLLGAVLMCALGEGFKGGWVWLGGDSPGVFELIG